jgi:hypothetical protein
VLEFDKSQRFTNFVRFLEKQGIVKLTGGVATIAKPDVLDAIGLAFFTYYIARGMSASRRVTFVPVSSAQTALLVEPLPADDGIFLRGKKDGDYVGVAIPPTMRATKGLCPGKAAVHANWATYMDQALPDMPECGDCPADDTCATAQWIAQYLRDHPEDSLGLVGGHALLIEAPAAVFELVGTEPVVAEDDPEATMAGAKDLDMKYFDAYLTLDLAAAVGAKVYVPNTQLAKPVASPYECDVVVYDKAKDYLAVVETAMGVGTDEEALLEEKAELGTAAQQIPPLALRIRKKHSSHVGLAALGVKNYRYVYASVGKLDFGEAGKEHAAYASHLMKASPPMRVVELEALEPEVLRLREPKWWKPQTLTDGFHKFRDAIRANAAPPD